MKKFSLVIFCKLISVCCLNAQCILINMNVTDCSSCWSNISSLDPKNTGLPTYVLFPKFYQEDSMDLSKRFKYPELGFEMVFSDFLYGITKSTPNTTTVCFFDRFGEIIWKKDLKKIDEDFVTDSIMKEGEVLRSDPSVVNKFYGGKRYSFNYGVGNLKIYDKNNTLLKRISSDEFDFSKLRKNIPKSKLNKFDLGLTMNQNSVAYTPSYKWFDIDANGNVLLMFQYAEFINDSLTEAAHAFCLAKFDSELNLIDIYPIQQSGNRYLFNDMFMVGKGNDVVILNRNFDGFEKSRNISERQFIGHYSLINNIYVNDQMYPFELPLIYKMKYFENYLSLNYSSYPIAAFEFSNSIFNLDNGNIGHVINEELYKSVIDVNGTSNGENEPFDIISTVLDGNKLLLFYKMSKLAFLNIYDSKSLHLLEKRTIQNPVFNNDINFIEIDKSSRLLFIYRSKANVCNVIPLDCYL